MLKNLLSGGRDAIPIMVAYLMIGIAAGVFGVSKGLSPAEVALLSLLLFAGSAQFVFPELYGGSPQALVSAIFFINLRHLLYSSALAPQARNLKWQTRATIGAQLTDETFLTSTAHLKGQMIGSGAWMIGLNMASYLSWACGNVLGAIFGDVVDLTIIGVEFAGSAMFIALLFPQIMGHSRPLAAAIIAAIAGGGAVLALLFFPGPATVIIVATLAATAGVFIFGVSENDKNFAAQLQTKAPDNTLINQPINKEDN